MVLNTLEGYEKPHPEKRNGNLFGGFSELWAFYPTTKHESGSWSVSCYFKLPNLGFTVGHMESLGSQVTSGCQQP